MVAEIKNGRSGESFFMEIFSGGKVAAAFRIRKVFLSIAS